MKALARIGGRLPGGSAAPDHRTIFAALDWLPLFLPAAVLIGEMLQPVLIISVSFRS